MKKSCLMGLTSAPIRGRMLAMDNTFIEQVLRGEATVEDIDNAVEEWHADRSFGSLQDWLGMTPAEYQAWVRDAGAIVGIVASRKQGGN